MSDLVCNSAATFFFRQTLACDLSRVRQAAASVREVLASRGASEDNQVSCELAVVEACNNAILYANESEREKPIEIHLMGYDSTLEIHVIDHTPGFEWPGSIELPEADAEHGRGLFIIRSIMEQVVYLRAAGENRLILRKGHVFPGHESASPQTAELTQTQEKLALSEQVIHTMAQELYSQILSAKEQREAADSRLLAHELQIARKIQNSLLPSTFPSLPGFDLSGFCLSARQVGGDFYDALSLSNDVALLVVADVMGKGVPAALFAATLRTLVRTTVQWMRRPAKLLRRINRLMFEDLSRVDMFITAQLVLVDLRVGRLVISNAGHCPLLLKNGAGGVETVSAEGMPLGIKEDAQFEEEVVPLAPNGCALLYSDGLTEARNPGGELFGLERLRSWLRQHAEQHASAAQLTEQIQSELNRFQANVSPADDQTFLILAPKAIASSECGPAEELALLGASALAVRSSSTA